MTYSTINRIMSVTLLWTVVLLLTFALAPELTIILATLAAVFTVVDVVFDIKDTITAKHQDYPKTSCPLCGHREQIAADHNVFREKTCTWCKGQVYPAELVSFATPATRAAYRKYQQRSRTPAKGWSPQRHINP